MSKFSREGLTCEPEWAKVAGRADNALVSEQPPEPHSLPQAWWTSHLPLAGLYAQCPAVSTVPVLEELDLAFASLRRFAFAAVFSTAALAAHVALAAGAAPEPDRTVDMATVLKPGTLPELTVGDSSGVPVVEYGSLTCPHCATFSREIFPELKKDYIDTGKVHFIFREFARNSLDVAAFMLARCVGDDKAFAAVELLFATQDKWAFVDKPLEPLIAAMRPAGLTHDQAMTCLKDQSKADALIAVGKRATDEIKMTGTPTFVIDSKVYGGELSIDQLKAILDPIIKK
jgi:protein-disulfide isomerase